MPKIIFVGPTLPYSDLINLNLDSPIVKVSDIVDIVEAIETDSNTIYVLPPVRGGDLYELRNITGNLCIAIIDGYFENTISVWHKEILYLLSAGKTILGSSSMGALRAAELSPFNMIGVGDIFEKFKSGIYTDDDEVTIAHGPKELGYPSLSEAMANIRATVSKALDAQILTSEVANIFLNVAKSTFYKDRNYGYLIRICIDQNGLKEKDFSKFHIWLQGNRVDQKKLDAIQLVEILESPAHISNIISNRHKPFEFEDTVIWRAALDA